MSLVVSGGTVVTSLDPVGVVHGDVEIEGGRVVRVLPQSEGTPARATAPEDAAQRIDARGCLVIPGNVCAHTHLYSSLARGMPYTLEPPQDFIEVLRRVWWRLDRALDAPSIRASALVGGAEALLAGTTALVDHHASPEVIDGSLDLVAEALAGLGIRGVLAYEVTDRDGPERSAAGVAENRRFAARASGGSMPLARAMIGAHASFTLSDATLAACVDAVEAAGVGLHIHVAEDQADEDDCRERFGMSVVERLTRAGAMDSRTLVAHAVRLQGDEPALVLEAGATVLHNARSNMNNRVGRPPLARLGSRVALGTDGIGADMFEESRVAYLRAREDGITGDPSWALARLGQSARVAGDAFGEPLLGRLEAGAPADLVVLDYPSPAPIDARSLPGHWIFGLSARNVRDVVVAGEVAVRDRRLTRMDGGRLAAEARDESARLWDRLGRIAEHPFDPRRAAAR
ncbi:MAG: amidohydrolase family protein [Chloroflexota bacterium]